MEGFSLLEMLVVITVIAAMMSLLLPAVAGFSGTASRRGAVNILMNTFEQARVAAIESGRPVYVLFFRRTFPERDALMVLRETEDPAQNYEQLTKWIKLPKGVLFHSPSHGNNMLKFSLADAEDKGFKANRIPVSVSPRPSESLNVLAFTASGAVAFPTSAAQRSLIVSEGVRGEEGTEALVSANKNRAGGFEIISLSRFTGRAQLDITTVN